jgi:hypothetical protein
LLVNFVGHDFNYAVSIGRVDAALASGENLMPNGCDKSHPLEMQKKSRS